MGQQLKWFYRKNKAFSKELKEDQFKQKALAESNTEREEHDIPTEEASETVLFQPALACTLKNSASLPNP